MKNIFTNALKGFFSFGDWNPNSISGLGNWENYSSDDAPAAVNKRTARGVPHPSLPLAERLKQVEADLRAFDESLPDLKGEQQ